MIEEERIIIKNKRNIEELTRVNIGQELLEILNIYIELDVEKENIKLISNINSLLDDITKDINKKIEPIINVNSKEIIDLDDNKNLFVENNKIIIPLITLNLKEVAVYHNADDDNEDIEDLEFEVIFNLIYNEDFKIEEFENNLEEIMDYIFLYFISK